MSSINLTDMTPEQVSNFCGVLNRNVKGIEQHFGLRLRFKEDRLDLLSSETVPQTVIDTVEHILEQSRKAALSLEAGRTDEVALKAEKVTTIVRFLNDEYFLVLALEPEANLGRGRFLLRLAAPKVLQEL